MDPWGQAPQRETLQGGPTRTPLLSRFMPAWGRRGAALIAFVLGVIGGGGVVGSWSDRSPNEVLAPSPQAATSSDVRLVLSGVEGPAQPSHGKGAGPAPLRIDGALLHDRGTGSATVRRIHRPGESLSVRVPALPVKLSVNQSYQRVRLEILPRDCELATQWTPSAQPFTLTWEDGNRNIHVDVGGDHDASMELAMIRYLEAACGDSGAR